jgi:Fe-S-cluster containining protein
MWLRLHDDHQNPFSVEWLKAHNIEITKDNYILLRMDCPKLDSNLCSIHETKPVSCKMAECIKKSWLIP